MSYLSADLYAPIVDNSRQPVDMSNDDWALTMYAGSRNPAPVGVSQPWLTRQPPKLRQQRTAAL